MSHQFDTQSRNIIAISYPPGGFGHFIYYVLTHYFKETVKVDDSAFAFSSTGDSHASRKYVPTWTPRHTYTPNISTSINEHDRIVVLCDHGWNHSSAQDIWKDFPNAHMIRMVIDTDAEPVIYHTYTNKTGNGFDHAQHVITHWTEGAEAWAQRENFTLWYHSRPFAFGPIADSQVVNLNISQLLTAPAENILSVGSELGLTAIDSNGLIDFCNEWLTSQQKYCNIFLMWHRITHALDNKINLDLSTVQDLHDQGYINYRIEQRYNLEIPVYDYRDWFADTDQMQEMIRLIKRKNHVQAS